jgi:cell wall-associated NlpC family hydrolase
MVDALDFRHIPRTAVASAVCLVALLASSLYSKTPSKSDAIVQKSATTDSASNRRQEFIIYVVKKGDSLYGIAGSYGTTVKALKANNHLTTNRLQIGQKLSIPAAPGANKSGVSSDLSKAKTTADNELRRPDLNTNQFTQDSAAGQAPLETETITAAEQGSLVEDRETDLSSQPLRYRLASAGLEWLGVRYRRSGTSEEKGFDCSGLVKRLFEKFRIGLPRSSREQYKEGMKVEKDSLEVGDLVFFSSKGKVPNHVGIYIGDNMFIHAALRAKQVMISNLTSPWYKKRFLGARRLLDLWEEESQPEDQSSE